MLKIGDIIEVSSILNAFTNGEKLIGRITKINSDRITLQFQIVNDGFEYLAFTENCTKLDRITLN
jgi:hypothetical protein